MSKTRPIASTLLTFTPDPSLLRDLPDGPGIYRFHGEQDELIYVGKSNRIRRRVASHFSARHRDHRENRMAWLTRRISFTETAGELGALLLENREIKETMPIFNRRQRRSRSLCSLYLTRDARGFLVPVTGNLAGDRHCRRDSFGIFRSRTRAVQTLEALAREHQLCRKVLGLETGPGPCFARQLRRCRGACSGEESCEAHNHRLHQALADLHIAAWPWPDGIIIREASADHAREDFHVVVDWRYLGTADSRRQARELLRLTPPAQFDLDTYRILMRHRHLLPD